MGGRRHQESLGNEEAIDNNIDEHHDVPRYIAPGFKDARSRIHHVVRARSQDQVRSIQDQVEGLRSKPRPSLLEVHKTPGEEEVVRASIAWVRDWVRSEGHMMYVDLHEDRIHLVDGGEWELLRRGDSVGFAMIVENEVYVCLVDDREDIELYIRNRFDDRRYSQVTKKINDATDRYMTDNYPGVVVDSEEYWTILNGEEYKKFESKEHDRLSDELNREMDLEEKKELGMSKVLDQETVVHELLHLVGKQMVIALKDSFVARSGYGIPMVDKGKVYGYAFTSLNEAIVESMARGIVLNNLDDINLEYISRTEVEQKLKERESNHEGPYGRDIEILELIVSGIARHDGETEDVVRKRFIDGYFNGDASHLGDIDRVFGTGKLKEYANLDPSWLFDEEYMYDVRGWFCSTKKEEQPRDLSE